MSRVAFHKCYNNWFLRATEAEFAQLMDVKARHYGPIAVSMHTVITELMCDPKSGLPESLLAALKESHLLTPSASVRAA